MSKDNKSNKLQWHPAFYGAMHLELKDNHDDLIFTEELILNTMPLRVDMLIITKQPDCTIQNEIGHIFRRHNLIEYKSPDDTLNYNVFYKGIAYALLYKTKEAHVGDISFSEMTLTFIRERMPIKLFKRLKGEHFAIEEKTPGIYYISKDGFIRIQIVVCRKLSRENHIWLNSLSSQISVDDAAELIRHTKQLTLLNEKNYADSLWEIVASVNKKTIETIREDNTMCKALAEIMKPEIDEAFQNGFDNGFNNGFDDGILNKGLRTFKNMIKEGIPKEIAQKCTELSNELVEKALAEMNMEKATN